MTRVLVRSFGVSLDGYGAGPDQSLDNPLGVRGLELMQWRFPTRSWHQYVKKEGGETGRDEQVESVGFDNLGAWILGRNMFGPVRGPWPDESWRGWWGEEPPYHVPTFVLTHHARAPLEMQGGTTFHFVTGGIHEALERAKDAAAGKDVRVGGGASTVRQYVQARLMDELHLAVSPVLLGGGEALFAGLDWRACGYEVAETVQGERALHYYIRRSGQ
jgi:dihydrofolate reductase